MHPARDLLILFFLCVFLTGAGMPPETAAASDAADTASHSSEFMKEEIAAAADLRLPTSVRNEKKSAVIRYDPEKKSLEFTKRLPRWYCFLADKNTEALLLPMEEPYAELQQALFYAESRSITSGLIRSIRIAGKKNKPSSIGFRLNHAGRLLYAAGTGGRMLHYYYEDGHLTQIFLKKNGELLQYAELFWSEESESSERMVEKLLFIDSSGSSVQKKEFTFSRTHDGVITALTVKDCSDTPLQENGSTAAADPSSGEDSGIQASSDPAGAASEKEYVYQHNEDGTIQSILARTEDKAYSRYVHDEYGRLLCMEDTVFSYGFASELSSDIFSDQPAADTDESEAPHTADVTFDRGYVGGDEYAFILGRSADGSVTWQKNTAFYPSREVSQTGEIGCYGDQVFYYYAGGSVYALDMQTGAQLWQNDQFGGGSAVSAIGPDGTVYICGYYGPSFMAISPQGYTLFNSYYLGYAILWPAAMEYDREQNLIYVTMEADMTHDGSPTVCVIDPFTFGFYFQ